ncbi:MAG: L-lactate permease [Actinobacteria bacterium]|nr:L-lactate permease [Actinomycetota bacterium]
MEAPGWAVAVATLPVLSLAVLVLRRQPLTRSAAVATVLAAVLSVTVFRLDVGGLGVGVLRGLWTGGWILAIVLPALLLFGVLERSGMLDRLADVATGIAPTPARQRLLLAWILPSFLQGAAGFGTPIAMVAPMLVRVGLTPIAALATSLIGYQWAVTFGSMGSSYFMAAGTARLDEAAAASFALRTGVVLAASCIVSGLLVLGGRREDRRDLPVTLLIGAVMGGTLVAVVTVQPALGSVVAGLAGLLVAYAVLPRGGGDRPRAGDLLQAAFPYLVLTATVVVAYGIGPVRRGLEEVPRIAPVLPGTTAAFGHVNDAAAVTPAFHPLLHPWIHLLVAATVGVLVYRRQGRWPPGTTGETLRAWGDRAGAVSWSILTLTVLASILTEAGMIAVVAVAAATLLGYGFVVASPLLGAFGTVLTGSTTASNALFASLQADVAERLGLAVPALLSGQTAGGNLGNALSPINIAVGAAVVGVIGQEGEVVRRNLRPAAILAATVVVAVVVQVLLTP